MAHFLSPVNVSQILTEIPMELSMPNQRSSSHFARPLVAAALLCGLLAAPALLAGQQPYKILDRWKLGGEGGWDYLAVDSPAHRLYLTHGAKVDVVDTETGKPVGGITGLKGTHGVAFDDAGKFGYISDGKANAVVVFDRATLATVATIPAGTNPDGILFEPVTQTVWAFNGRSKDTTVIDAATRKVLVTLPLPGKPEFPVADGKGTIFVNIEDKNEIVRLDTKGDKLAAWPLGAKFAEWALKDCESPSGLAYDAAGARLFPVCDGKKMGVVDANTGKTLANPAIGDGPDAAGWDAAHKLAFASSGDGILSVVDAGAPGYPTIESLPTQKGARTMAYDAATDRIYLVTAEVGPRPAPTAANLHPYPSIVPGTFTVLVVGR
jgi:YVTN family beta-propeller protein